MIKSSKLHNLFYPFFLLVLSGMLLALSACAPPAVEKSRFFFPPPPAEPRFEYVRFVQSDHDITEKNINWVEDAVFGRAQPYPLYTSPYDVASDGHGRILVSDPGLGQVLILDEAKAEIRYLKETDGSSYRFVTPFALDADSAGFVAVSDITKKKVFLFGPDEKLKTTITLDKKVNPVGLVIDAARSRIFLVDTPQHKIHLYSFDGELLEYWGSRGKELGEFNYPVDADLDEEGNLYVLDAMNFRVQVFSADGEPKMTFGEQGTAAGSFRMPKGLAVSPSGLVFVTDALGHRFVVFSTSGEYLLTVGGKSRYTNRQVLPGGFYLPRGIDADSNDGVWVVDALNRTVHNFQYLNEDYLQKNPIQSGQSFLPAK
jgi:sugar lactone lactonase YvrE